MGSDLGLRGMVQDHAGEEVAIIFGKMATGRGFF
jgi:hypothetical protein